MSRINTTRSDYRADIDGIRSLAVLSVFLFHLHPQLLPGGFLGVDVFFVISGYLITKIIIRENHVGRFSFLHFYARRVKRIFPALFVVLGLTAGVATFLLTPETYANFMRSAHYAAVQLSNFMFAREVGYFDEGFSGQPLLHTWSLGVEEQFYLFWPLLIFLCFYFYTRYSETAEKRKKAGSEVVHSITLPSLLASPDTVHQMMRMNHRVAKILFMLSLVSFAACYYLTDRHLNQAFYMFYARAWEFCVGGFVALRIIPSPRGRILKHVTGTIGLTLLIISFWFVKEETLGVSFLKFGVILPCIGTGLLIYVGSAQGLANRLLAMRLPVFIGKISYSLYLYHWPVIILWKLFDNSSELGLGASLGIIAVSFLLSILSFYCVEQPARKSRLSDRQVLYCGAVIVAAFALSFKYLGQYDLASWRIAKYANEPPPLNTELDDGCTTKIAGMVKYLSCDLTEEEDAPSIALVGDSHSPHYFLASVVWARKRGYDLIFLSTPGCPMLVGDVRIKSNIEESHERECKRVLPFFEKYIVKSERIQLILIAQRFDLFYNGKGYLQNSWKITFSDKEGKVVPDHSNYYREHFGSTVDAIREADKDLIVLKQVPLMSNIKSCNWEPRLKKLFKKERVCSYDNEFIETWQTPSVEFIDDLTAQHQVAVFDPTPYFKSPIQNGVNIYQNSDHLNIYGHHYMIDPFGDAMDEIVADMDLKR